MNDADFEFMDETVARLRADIQQLRTENMNQWDAIKELTKLIGAVDSRQMKVSHEPYTAATQA